MSGVVCFEEIVLSMCVYEIGIVEGEDADYVVVGVVFGLYLSIYDQELEFFFYDQEPEYFFTTRNQRTGVILNVEFWILN